MVIGYFGRLFKPYNVVTVVLVRSKGVYFVLFRNLKYILLSGYKLVK